MHKIDTDTAVGNEFVDGNAAASIKATRLNAKWFNTIQRELCKIVESAEISLSDTDDAQIVAAMAILFERALLSEGHEGKMTFVSRSGQTATFSANEVRFRLAHGEECVVGADSVTLNNGSSSTVITSEGVEIKNSDGSTAAKFAAGGEFGTLLSRNGLEVQKGTSQLQDVVAETGTFHETLKTLKDLIVAEVAYFGNEDRRIELSYGDVVASRMVEGKWLRTDTYVGYKVYSATTEDDVKNPNALLSDVQKEKGASVLVSNDSGDPVSITRHQASGSNLMTLVVNPGEMLWYVYNGTSWVHSW